MQIKEQCAPGFRVANLEPNITWHANSVTRMERQKLIKQKGLTLWLTGLSGSGKSTIACLLERFLLQHKRCVYLLDGDNLRFGLNKDLGFTPQDRKENARRVAEVARLFSDATVISICASISPYAEDRLFARQIHESQGLDFIEVHVDVSLAEAEKRDPKGLYVKARRGDIKAFTGIDSPYEAPIRPEIHLNCEVLGADEAAQEILAYLESKMLI